MKRMTRIAMLVFAFAMALTLVACGGSEGGSASSAASSADASASSAASESENASEASASDEAASEGSGESAAAELYGKPWVTSIVQGNLPAEAPEVTDDLYTHYAYDYLAAHQVQPSTAMLDNAAELQTANLAVIKDSSKTGHDLDQLRIFFEQAADAETLQKTGLAEVQPYLDRIDAVASIEDMNALLSADDFPFSPFVLTSFTLKDTRDVNIVAVSPNLALVDTVLVGGAYYQDSDDPQVQQSIETAIRNMATMPLLDLVSIGMDQDETEGAFATVLAFEKAHGKYVDYNGKYSQMDFGTMAEVARDSYFTMDELCAACPNFPMKETLAKLGKDGSPTYVSTHEWLEAFNGLWTNDNIEAIKLIAKMKVLAETRPYRDNTIVNQTLEAAGQPAQDADSFAYAACNQQDTFAIALAQTYVDEALGADAKERLTKLAEELIDTYKGLVDNTSWLGEESQKRVIEKLDNMTLNVLEPTGGYYDFSGVELTPTSEGGTLLGNYLKLKQYRLDQESKMVGQSAVAACPWFFVRPTEMNAFYDPTSNSINIYPGYVTSLVYSEDMSDQDLLAGAGFSIGHEISHGFDYQGAQFDAYGTPNPVFADADVDAFVLKCSTLASYYNGLEVAPDTMANGTNVVTEAAADLCGMQAILELAAKDKSVDYDKFFDRTSNVWAQVALEATLPNLLLDAHPLNNLRVNVNAQMFAPIYDALGVAEGDAMYLAPNERINIWGPNA